MQLMEEQKILLFTAFMELPTSEQMKVWKAQQSSNVDITEETSNNLLKLGYTDEQINKIKDQLAKAGLTE